MNKDHNNKSENSQYINRLVLSTIGINYLNRATNWTKFIAISSFVGGGLFFLIGFSGFGNPYNPYPVLSLFLLFTVSVIIILPAIYLYNFSNQAKFAVRDNDSMKLELCISSLKKYIKTYGIIIICVIGLTLFWLVVYANPYQYIFYRY